MTFSLRWMDIIIPLQRFQTEILKIKICISTLNLTLKFQLKLDVQPILMMVNCQLFS